MAINRATRRVAPPSVETGVLEGASMQSDEPLDQLIDRERAERLWEPWEAEVAGSRDAGRLLHPRPLADRDRRELDVPLGTVKRRLHTARKRLKVELETSVADPDEWTDGANFGPNDEEEDGSECVGAGVSSSGW